MPSTYSSCQEWNKHRILVKARSSTVFFFVIRAHTGSTAWVSLTTYAKSWNSFSVNSRPPTVLFFKIKSVANKKQKAFLAYFSHCKELKWKKFLQSNRTKYFHPNLNIIFKRQNFSKILSVLKRKMLFETHRNIVVSLKYYIINFN